MKRWCYIGAPVFLCLMLCVVLFAPWMDVDRLGYAREVGGLYTVSFYQGDVVLSRQKILEGDTISAIPSGAAWCDDEGARVYPERLTVTGKTDFYVQENPYLSRRHVRVLQSETNRFYPAEAVTRGQAAEIISSLLDPNVYVPLRNESGFYDVERGTEYFVSVRRLAALGMIEGYDEGDFRPDEPMTRAEFITLLCRFMGVAGEGLQDVFPDVPSDHWAANSIGLAAGLGWVEGYDDGNFYPDAPLTRAAAAVMVNRARGRNPNELAIDAACEQYPYVDVAPSSWAYYDVVDVSYDNEFLSHALGEAEDAAPGFVILGDELCHVNEDLCLDYYEAGFHTIDGGLYYVAEDGYFIQRFQAGYVELDGSMFYVKDTDGPFATDYWRGYLHFGENGRYTSGDETVDAYVDEILANVVNDPSTSSARKLYLAYCLIRDGGYKFMNRNTGWQRGATGWTLQVAKVFYQSKRGSCFYWAAGFMYLARRLGYQARSVIGGAGGANELHAWVVINIGGVDYIFDPEMEWAINYGYFSNPKYGNMVDLFMQPAYDPVYEYHFP